MNTPFDLKSGREDRIVYVRPAEPSDLPDTLEVTDDIYSVHAPDGELLALVQGRATAFALARQNDFSPVTVH